jgi:hypothetical protein
MVAVYDAKTFVHDWDQVRVARYQQQAFFTEDTHEVIEPNVLEELIQGRKFKARDGRIVCVGWDQALQDALQIPFDAFEDMSYRITRLEHENQKLWELDNLRREAERSPLFRFVKAVQEYIELI